MTTLSGRTKLPKLFKLVDGTDIPSTILRSAAPIYIDGLPTGAGDHDHSIAANTAAGLAAATTLQDLAVALSTRIKALEDAAGAA